MAERIEGMNAVDFERQAAQARFSIGSVVALKSCGPSLTVEQIRQDGLIVCLWFGGAVVHRDAFDALMLVGAV